MSFIGRPLICQHQPNDHIAGLSLVKKNTSTTFSFIFFYLINCIVLVLNPMGERGVIGNLSGPGQYFFFIRPSRREASTGGLVPLLLLSVCLLYP